MVNLKDFDPSLLERAAKAARDLESNRHAQQILEAQVEGEKTKQQEMMTKQAEYKAAQEQFRIENTRVTAEEKRRLLQMETEQQKERSKYQDQLARQRKQYELEQQARMNSENLRRQEESAMRLEKWKRETEEQNQEQRRKTMQYESELRMREDASRIEAESRGRTSQERANEDVRKRLLKAQAEETRTSALQKIELVFDRIGNGMQYAMNNPQVLTNTALTITAVSLGIYASKQFTRVAAEQLQVYLGKPPLVRETSKKGWFAHLMSLLRRKQDTLTGIVLPPATEKHLATFVRATQNTKRHGANFRNLLLYGPPGTGKTLFAKSLAMRSGLDFAIMTGGDVAPLGRDAVSELHKLFAWAEKKSKKGMILFVDEADAFLRQRTGDMSEDQRNALNTFLYKTGTQSNKFMVVLATNHPEMLDWSVNDRIDEMMEFSLPGYDERLRMIHQYLREIRSNSQNLKLDPELDQPEVWEDVARRTEGFSGREISKLVYGWQSTVFGSEQLTLNRAILEEVLGYKIEENARRRVLSKYATDAQKQLQFEQRMIAQQNEALGERPTPPATSS